MSQKDKLVKRLRSRPRNFTFEEAESLLGYLGYERFDKGRTSGSCVAFISPKHPHPIYLHKPHPRKELLEYQIKILLEQLEQEGLL